MPQGVAKKSWSQVWKASPDSTFDATPLSKDAIAKQFIKESMGAMATGELAPDEAAKRLDRIQGVK